MLDLWVDILIQKSKLSDSSIMYRHGFKQWVVTSVHFINYSSIFYYLQYKNLSRYPRCCNYLQESNTNRSMLVVEVICILGRQHLYWPYPLESRIISPINMWYLTKNNIVFLIFRNHRNICTIFISQQSEIYCILWMYTLH